MTLSTDGASSANSDPADYLDWTSITKDGMAYIKAKDAKGEIVLKQYGMLTDDDSQKFMFTDGDAPTAWELLKQDKLVFLVDGC